jgi:ATP-binding cassette subfamily B protein
MQVTFRQYYEILARYLRPQRVRVVLLGVLVLLGIGVQLTNPQVMGRFIDGAKHQQPEAMLLMLAGCFIALALVSQVVGVALAYTGEYVAWVATNALREDLATHCLSLDMSFHHEKSPGELIERIEGDALEFAVFFSQVIVRSTRNILLLIGTLTALFLLNWQVGLAFTVFAVVAFALLLAVRSIAVPHQKAFRDANTDLFGFLEERLAGTEDIRASGAVGFVLRRLMQLQTHILRTWRKAQLTTLIIRLVMGMLVTAGFGTAYVLGASLVQSGALSIGAVFIILSYTWQIAQPVRELTQQMESLQNIGATIERMSEMLKQRSAIVDGPGAGLPEGTPLALAFEDVDFAYHDDTPILHGVSFAIPAGHVMGLLGRTGSGKSTIARLVFRLYDPQGGAVRLDGTDIRQATVEELRHRVAFVTQEVQLFQASVRDNITFFDPTVPDTRILEVIEALELGDWFAGLPDGLDTRLQTGGRSLSAGEAQLLAFTRVFLRNPGLVVLDEASSRLDPATEGLIERALDHLLAGRTAVIIAHRLGTLHRAHDVLLLEDGRVAEYGNRQALLADEGSRFRALYQAGLEEVLA